MPRDCWRSNAALKLGSSVADFVWGVSGWLSLSNLLDHFTGLWVTFFPFAFPERAPKLLGPGKLAKWVLTGTFFTRPSSTTVKIWTPDRDAESRDNSLSRLAAYHCSFVFYFLWLVGDQLLVETDKKNSGRWRRPHVNLAWKHSSGFNAVKICGGFS